LIVRPIAPTEAWRLLCGAGLAPGATLEILNRETAAGGALGLWLEGQPQGAWRPRYLHRRQFRFVRGVMASGGDAVGVLPINPMEFTPKGPLLGVVHRMRFQLDAEQVEALIAELTKPKRQRGRRRKYDWPAVDSAIRAAYEAHKSKDPLAEHVQVRLEKEKILSPKPDQLRKRIAKLFPDDAQK
jgi:hypothetical protein